LKALHVAEQTDDSTRIATLLLNIGAVYAHKKATYDKALDYYLRALPISRSLSDRNIIGTINANIGEIYLLREEVDLALPYFKESLRDYAGSENTPYALNNLGKAYQKKGDYAKAIQYHQQALNIARKLETVVDEADALLGLADTYMKTGPIVTAIDYYKRAEEISLKISPANDEMKYAYIGLALAYAQQEDFANAYKYQALYTSVKDSLYNIDTDKKLSGLQFNFDIQKKQAQVDLLTKDKIVKDLQLKRQNVAKNILIAGLAIAFIFATVLYRNYRNKIKVNKILDKQNAEIQSLILNILPQEVADELQRTGNATPKYYEKASVLFTDFKSFSSLADSMTPQDVVSELNECFVAFDEIIERNNLEKIKTIGDSYMCAGGIPTEDDDHPIKIVRASLQIQDFIKTRNAKRLEMNLPPWDIRVGINTGPLVAGVVGRKKYAYDIWGGTVNVASRLESNGEPGQINISAATYELVKHIYPCTYRGKIYAKNIGEIDMYFVNLAMN
jgi:class 3 adenylate cyclase/Tfp pilus assembly protein PilF